MNRIQAACSAALLGGTCAYADPVFFDDFDGDELKPWWKISPSGFLEYTVANSLLSVTYVKDFSANLSTKFDPLGGDSEAIAAMGWAESGGYDQEFYFVISSGAIGLASFGFREKAGEYVVRASVAGGSGFEMPAPPPGIHDFAILRQAGEFHFLLDDAEVAVFPDASGDPIAGVFFHFSAASPISPLIVDRVTVTPAPAVLAISPIAVTALSRRKRPHISLTDRTRMALCQGPS